MKSLAVDWVVQNIEDLSIYVKSTARRDPLTCVAVSRLVVAEGRSVVLS